MSVAKTYKLDYYGAQVNEAIRKILEMDPSVSGITVLESSETSRYDLNALTAPGIYTTEYATSKTSTTGLTNPDIENSHPILIIVARDTSDTEYTRIRQTVNCGAGDIITRSTITGGLLWDEWVYTQEGADVHVAITADEVNQLFSD